MTDPTAPDVYAPPHQVYEWTTIPGHEVRLLRRASDDVLLGTCTCGERQVEVDTDWRKQHLRDAWPVLVPREPDESVEAWRQRLVAVLEEARTEDERLSSDLSRRMHVKPGEPYPVITEEDIAASQRVDVLEHQLAWPPFRDMP